MCLMLLQSCKEKPSYKSFSEFTQPTKSDLWLNYNEGLCEFKIWSPTATNVRLHLYKNGDGNNHINTYDLNSTSDGIWTIKINSNLKGLYYTYQTKINYEWQEETPGIYARAVGVNGKRAMVLDLESTNPMDWKNDTGPDLKSPNEAIIYEMHIRDFSIHETSGIRNKGKFLGVVEKGTKTSDGLKTGLDHLKELGITHVHLLPSFDYFTVDESNLDREQYNWGYDPLNYNVPEGSYSTNPYDAALRIKEFKQMVKSLHDNGIGVIMDVVYNHTGKTQNSNFNLEVPDYYYRQWDDGSYSDASACGNEVASERAMVRKFIVESVSYWAKEYHMDGFRFDLMGIHDIETMNAISESLYKINPNILLYGEGWLASNSPLPKKQRATKANVSKISKIAAFSDELRDGLKGSVFEKESQGFVSGAKNEETSIQFGIVGAIKHPQIAFTKVNYSNKAWAKEPWQSVSYVSCHDNHTAFDKLKLSNPNTSKKDIIAMQKLANAIVLTSQGISFLHSGSDFLRTKNGIENSYKSPDSINQIDWNRKSEYLDVFNYYKNLITLRKLHPAFRMTNAEDVINNLHFEKIANGIISYTLNNNANEDTWKRILVVYNANPDPILYQLEDSWNLVLEGDAFDFQGEKVINDTIKVPPISTLIAFQK